jgi:hypothetical protein
MVDCVILYKEIYKYIIEICYSDKTIDDCDLQEKIEDIKGMSQQKSGMSQPKYGMSQQKYGMSPLMH